MQEHITQIESVAQQLRELKSPSPYVGNAISALGAARDNLTWEREAQAKQETERGREGETATGKPPRKAATKADVLPPVS
jgi:hypothetical protein